jgi:hypothetical protein
MWADNEPANQSAWNYLIESPVISPSIIYFFMSYPLTSTTITDGRLSVVAPTYSASL